MPSLSAGSSSAVVLEDPSATADNTTGPSVPFVPKQAVRTTIIPGPPAGNHGDNSDSIVGTVDAPTGLPGAAQDLRASTVALTLMSLGLSNLLSALDLTIVTTALPSIVADFQSTAGYIWVGSAFILSYTAITPIWGSVADIWGRKPIILMAVALFLVGSLLCALAPNMDVMIAGRAVQGLGASGMSVLVNIIISDLFPLRDRGLYLAGLSIVWAVGSSVGPLLGGLLTTKLK